MANVVYGITPIKYKHEIQDWYARIGTPSFTYPLNEFTKRGQADLIREYKNRGHQLECYGNLQIEERISKRNDYLCFIHISTAYDNIPARSVVFFFSEGSLTDVRIEFPTDSFDKLQQYLSKVLENQPRLDQLPQVNFGRDVLGNRLMVWGVTKGIIVTSDTQTQGHSDILLWSSKDWGNSINAITNNLSI